MSFFPQNNNNKSNNSTSSILTTTNQNQNSKIISQNTISEEHNNNDQQKEIPVSSFQVLCRRCGSSTHFSLRTVVTATFAAIGLAVTAFVILNFMSFFSAPIDGAILTFSGELGEQLRQTVVSNFDAGADAFFGLINFTTHQAGQVPFDPTELGTEFVKPNRRIDAYMNKIAVTTNRMQNTPWTATGGRFSDGSYYVTERYQIADPSNPQNDAALISFAEICNSYTGLYSSTTTASTIDVPYNCSFRQFYTNNFSTTGIRQDLITANGFATVTMPVAMRSDLFANSPLWKVLERIFTGPGSENLFAYAVPPFLITANASIAQLQQQTQAHAAFPDTTFRLLFGLLSMVYPNGNRSHSPIGWVASGVDMTVLSSALKATLSAAKYRVDGELLDFRAFLVDSSGQSAASTLSIEDQHLVVACSECASAFTVLPVVVLADYTPIGGQLVYPRGCTGRGRAFMACLQNISDYPPYDLLKQHLQQNERITNTVTPMRVANGTYIYSLTTAQDGEKFVIYKIDDVNTRSSGVFTASSAVSGFGYDLFVFIPRKYFTKSVDERMIISIVISVAISVFAATICLILVNAGVKKLEVFVEEMKKDPMRMEQQKNKRRGNKNQRTHHGGNENESINDNDGREVQSNVVTNTNKNKNGDDIDYETCSIICSSSSFEEIINLDDAFEDLRSMIFLLRGFFPDSENPLLGASVLSTATATSAASTGAAGANTIKIEKLMGKGSKKNNLKTEKCEQRDQNNDDQNDEDTNVTSDSTNNNIENRNGAGDKVAQNGSIGHSGSSNNAHGVVTTITPSSKKAVSFLPGFVEHHDDENKLAPNDNDDNDDDDDDFANSKNSNSGEGGNEKINPKTMNLVDLADSEDNENFSVVDLEGHPQDTNIRSAAAATTSTTSAATKIKQSKDNHHNKHKHSRKTNSTATTSLTIAPLHSTTIVRDKLGNPFVKGLVCVINIIGTTESFSSSSFSSLSDPSKSSSLLSSLLNNNNYNKNNNNGSNGSNRNMRKGSPGKTNALLTASGSSSSLSSQNQNIIIATRSKKDGGGAVDESTGHLASSSVHNLSATNTTTSRNGRPNNNNNNNNQDGNRFDDVKLQLEQNLERKQREQELRVQVLERAGRRLTRIVTILRDRAVTSMGAHLVEFRGDHFVLCLKLSARTLPSRLAQRFVGQLMDAAEEIAEMPEQRSLNAPSFDRCCENVAQGLMRQQQQQQKQQHQRNQSASANYLPLNDSNNISVNNDAAGQGKSHKYAVHALLQMVNSSRTHRDNIMSINDDMNSNSLRNTDNDELNNAHANSNDDSSNTNNENRRQTKSERHSYNGGKTIYSASFFNSAQFCFGNLALTAGIAVGPVRVLHNNMFFASQDEPRFLATSSVTNNLFDHEEKQEVDEEEKEDNDNNENQNKKPPLFSAAHSIGGGRPTNYLGNAFAEALAVEQASRRAVVHGLESQKIRLIKMYLNEVVRRKQYKRRLRQHENKQKQQQEQLQLQQQRQQAENIFMLSPPASSSASPNNTLEQQKINHGDSNSKEKQSMNNRQRRDAILHDNEEEDRQENDVDNNSNDKKLLRSEKRFVNAKNEESFHEEELMSKSNSSNNQKVFGQHSVRPEKTLPKTLMSSATTESKKDNRETKNSSSSSGVAFDLSAKAAQEQQQKRRATMFPTSTESGPNAALNNNNRDRVNVDEESEEDYDDDDDDDLDDLVVPIIVTTTEATESMSPNHKTASPSASYRRHLYFEPMYRSAKTNQYEKVSSLPHCIAYCIEAGTVGATLQLPAKTLPLPPPVAREKIMVHHESLNNNNDNDNQQRSNSNRSEKEKQFVVVRKFQNPLVIKELMGDNLLVRPSVARFVTAPFVQKSKPVLEKKLEIIEQLASLLRVANSNNNN